MAATRTRLRRFLRSLLPAACLGVVACAATKEAEGPFLPTWDSLQAYECPEWFRDAKFGIYAHWGPYSASGGSRNTDWYSRNMYREGHPNHAEHLKHHGPVDRFGYKDLAPLFTAEKFDADAWVDLYVEAGARFAGPVAMHADGFAMWDSEATDWNAKVRGPKRDVVGEMERAVRARGLKFLASFHHQWKWGWYPTGDPDADCSDPRYSGLYGPALPSTAWGMSPEPAPDDTFRADWRAKIDEVVVRYRPDMLWFDNRMRILGEAALREMVAFYYNRAHDEKREVVLTYKRPDLIEGTATIDLERARMKELYPEPWLTDTSVAKSTWGYATGIEYYPVNRLVDDLVDIVSKNGCLLLNIGPAPDGTIPDEQQMQLRAIGAWLRVNGEAIYATRPWTVFGEGPTVTPEGHLADLKFGGFTARDLRFTRSKEGAALFVIALGWPEEGRILVRSLASGDAVIDDVRMLGHEGALAWGQTDAGLEVSFPDPPPCEHAFTLRVTGAGLMDAR